MSQYLHFLYVAILASFIQTQGFASSQLTSLMNDLYSGKKCTEVCTKKACTNTKNPHDFAVCSLLCFGQKDAIKECLEDGAAAAEAAFGTSDPYRLLARADTKPEYKGTRLGKTKMCGGQFCNARNCTNEPVQIYCSAFCKNAKEGIAKNKVGQVNYGNLMQNTKTCQLPGWGPDAE